MLLKVRFGALLITHLQIQSLLIDVVHLRLDLCACEAELQRWVPLETSTRVNETVFVFMMLAADIVMIRSNGIVEDVASDIPG